MIKVLITGARGQVGAALVERLQTHSSYQVVAYDRASLDISDEQAVERIVQEVQPHILVNAAAYTAVDKAEREADIAYAINADGVRYLARVSKKMDALFIHLSTDYVFDGMSNQVYTELDAPNPQTQYGLSKLSGEKAILEENPSHIILRTAWVFGETGNNFVKTMLHLAKERTSLSIVDDQIGGPTYAGDIANAIIAVMDKWQKEESLPSGIYHYTGMPYVSWYDFAKDIFKEAQLQKLLAQVPVLTAIPTSAYPTPAQRPANSRLELHKIQQVFNIAPSDWQGALHHCLQKMVNT